MSPTLFFQLLSSALNTAVLLVVIDVNNLFRLSTLSSFDGLVCIFVTTLFYCNLSETITAKLLSIANIFYENDWYYLPVKQQKMVIIPIQRSQKEFRLKGLGLINCSLWIFASVSDCHGSTFVGEISKLRRKFSSLITLIEQILRTAGSYFILMQSLK